SAQVARRGAWPRGWRDSCNAFTVIRTGSAPCPLFPRGLLRVGWMLLPRPVVECGVGAGQVALERHPPFGVIVILGPQACRFLHLHRVFLTLIVPVDLVWHHPNLHVQSHASLTWSRGRPWAGRARLALWSCDPPRVPGARRVHGGLRPKRFSHCRRRAARTTMSGV